MYLQLQPRTFALPLQRLGMQYNFVFDVLMTLTTRLMLFSLSSSLIQQRPTLNQFCVGCGSPWTMSRWVVDLPCNPFHVPRAIGLTRNVSRLPTSTFSPALSWSLPLFELHFYVTSGVVEELPLPAAELLLTINYLPSIYSLQLTIIFLLPVHHPISNSSIKPSNCQSWVVKLS